MKVGIFGAGYVGLVSGLCLANMGHEVFISDIDEEKIAGLNRGVLPIYEPELESLFQKMLKLKRVHFTSDASLTISFADLIFIAVNALNFVYQVADEIAKFMTSPKIIVIKSTVYPGTALKIKEIILKQQNSPIEFDVASNPEFLREGSAISDFMAPSRIIIGTNQNETLEKLRNLYSPILSKGVPFIPMSTRSAELCKYAANAFLAMKISFINEFGRLSSQMGADIRDLQKALALDPRIGSLFLNPGCGYGGSCFPKDLHDLATFADANNCPSPILKAIDPSNEIQKGLLFDKLQRFFKGDLFGRRIGLWGASFKPNTDDIRKAPSCALLEKLWHAGAVAQVYDPKAQAKLRLAYPHEAKLILCQTAYEALENSDVLVILTEWDEFKQVDFARVRAALNFPLVLDGRNMFEPRDWHDHGLNYCGIGYGDELGLLSVEQMNI